MKDDIQPRKHRKIYIFLESIFLEIYIKYLASYVKVGKAGNEGRESGRSGGEGMFVPLQAMNVYKGKPRFRDKTSREFPAPVTVPLGIH